MNTEQLQELKTLVQNAGDLPDTAKDGILQLLAEAEQATATGERAPQEHTTALLSSVEEIEANHPEATAFVNRAAMILSNMGI